MKFTRSINETAKDVSEASKQVVSTSQVASIALVAVAALALVALGVGIMALSEAKR